MAITYQIENSEDFLKVFTSGNDESLEDVLNYVNAIVQAAIKYQSKKILCDERNLKYELSTTETFELAESIAKHIKNLAKITIVCNKKYIEDGKFLETASKNRGLMIRVTSNYNEALEWLEKKDQ